MRRFVIETWGCQMNVHDSEKMAGILRTHGYLPTASAATADLVLLNTCSVREKAASKVFNRLGTLRKLKVRNPDLLIGVCGCVAQQEGDAIFRRAPWVDLVMGPRNIAKLGRLLEEVRLEGRSMSLARDDEPIAFPAEFADRAPGPRAFVTVMEGCNKTCSFCIVPYTRGREVYRRAAEVIREARELAARGYSEIELLGQNVNAWREGEHDLASLLRMVDRIPGIRRIRFTTSHPGHLSQSIMRAFTEVPTVCNHLHLPAQSGSDRVLKAMRRGYTRAKYMTKIEFLRRQVPDMAFSTDLIVGFPGEREADFEATLALVREVRFDQVFAFTYSPRPGTTAAVSVDGLPEVVKAERLQRLLALQDEIVAERNTGLVGRTFEVLVDGRSRMDDRVLKGRTRCNRIVHLHTSSPARNGFLQVRISKAHAHSLTGEPIETPSAA